MEPLKVSFIQTQLIWENASANRAGFEKLMDQIDGSTDLVVLPEMFTTGFSMKSDTLSEEMGGDTVQWMKEQANKRSLVLCGSIIIKENGKCYNRLLWVTPEGKVSFYDKRHLFRMADENNYFSQGINQLIVSLKGWNICPLICYDLRFPVWSRNKDENYDMLIFVANWPAARVNAWEKLLFARAIENQCYVGAVNRIGEDEKGINYSGSSMAVDPKGELLWKAKDNQEEIKTITFDKEELQKFRTKFPVGMDADRFKIL